MISVTALGELEHIIQYLKPADHEVLLAVLRECLDTGEPIILKGGRLTFTGICRAAELLTNTITCYFCDAKVSSVQEAIEKEWTPSWYLPEGCEYISEFEISEPICVDCFLYYMQFNPEHGDFELRPYLVNRLVEKGWL